MFAPSPLPRNLEASFRDLGSENAATRASAARDLVRHASRSDETRSRAVGELEKALRVDPSAAVRAAAAVALADLAAHEALATLLVAVEDEDAHVRQMAICSLGEIGDARATPRLERALRDDRPEVRYQAVIAFARVARDDTDAVARELFRALDDSDAAIRYIAMRMAEESLASDAPGRALQQPPLSTRALSLVDGPDDALAIVAGLFLARLAHPRGISAVLDVVAETRGTPELEDEQACVEMTGELSLRDAIPHLERRAWGARRVVRTVLSWGAGDGRSCAWHARIALARMHVERARASFLTDLASRRRETREAAVVAIGRARMREAKAQLENLGGTVDVALVREALVRLAVD